MFKKAKLYIKISSILFLFTLIVLAIQIRLTRDNNSTIQKPIEVNQVQAQTSTCDSYLHNWPQVGHDPQHTGYSPQPLGQNINNVAWVHPFQPDKVYPQVQPIIYCNKVFVGGAYYLKINQ